MLRRSLVTVLLLMVLATGVSAAQTIEVWTWYGGILGGIFSDLVKEQFTAKTGIEVDIVTVPVADLFNKFLLSYLGGDAPDVLEMYSNQVVELGLRGALANLNTFPDVDGALKELHPGLMQALSFRGGVFALPGEVNWAQTYYRVDIFEDMGLEPPVTWDDFLSINHRLRARGMSSFYDFQGDMGQQATGRLLPLVYQRGGDIYNADGTGSALDTRESIEAFKFLTSLYTQHKVDLENPVFSPFVGGQTPMQILQNWHYSAIDRAAPHLAGKWNIVQMPGTRRLDGTIDHTNTGKMLVWAISNSSKKKDAAWEFMKWLTSAEYLSEFMKRVYESPEQWRLVFATRNALEYAVFPAEQLPVLQAALDSTKMNRAVVGGYISDRYIDFAFNRVVVIGDDPEVAIRQAAKESNSEIQQKLREFARFIDRL